MKKVLLSFLLVILIILLFIPFIFRLVGKDWYKDKPIKIKDSLETLNCNKTGETLNLTYVNNKPHNLQYLVKGNYQEQNDSSDNLDNNNLMFDDLKEFSNVTYDESKNITEIRIDLSTYISIPIILDKYTNKETASTYYASLGFSCTKSVVE